MVHYVAVAQYNWGGKTTHHKSHRTA